MRDVLSVAFVWHMHQPWYQDPATGRLTLPWVRLHAAKDYLDMVELLAEFPAIHQTFNLTPCLLQQLAWYTEGHEDDWGALAARPTDSLTAAEAARLTRQGLCAHPRQMIHPHLRYEELVAKVQRGHPLTPEELRDLTVWFHLVWLDPRWRVHDPDLAALVAKGGQFTEPEKALVLARHHGVLARVVPGYRAAQDRGQIEIATSPSTHPILPLLMDSTVARQATPGLPLPQQTIAWPEDVADHLARARQTVAEMFGRPPRGLWPSEGAVSEAILPAVAQAGFTWLASDEQILWNSVRRGRSPEALYQPYLVGGGDRPLAMLFRDQPLSDAIGFVYAGQPPAQAAADLLQRLRTIRDQYRGGRPPIVTIILDGENAWESYPEDGGPFLRSLYEGLSREPGVRCVTVSEYLAAHPPTGSLATLAAGSWIRGDFTTWIGHDSQNRAWDALARARAAGGHTGPRAVVRPPPADATATAGASSGEPLRRAQGSDWFWWFGPEHTSPDDDEFDRLFRQYLAQVYTTAGAVVPPSLARPIGRKQAVGVVQPSGWSTPTMDGRITDYFEWLSAGRFECAPGRGAMGPGQEWLRRVWWCCDRTSWYLRYDLATWPAAGSSVVITLSLEEPPLTVEVELTGEPARGACWLSSADGPGKVARPITALAAREIVELMLPLGPLGLRHGTTVGGHLQVRHNGQVVETIPSAGVMMLTLPEASDAHAAWSA